MTELPSELSYGHVVGRFLFAEGDGPDVGRMPDGAAASGTVKFTPLATIRRTTADPVTVLKKPVVCTLDSSGYLTDSQGARGVWLVAAQYKVDFTIDGVVVPSFNIVVDSADTEVDPLDLTLEAELTPEPSTKFVVNEQVYLDTLAARDDVLAAIPPGGTTGQVLGKASDADLDTAWITGGAGGGVTDHGALTGLTDDDHPQYHTDARGDLRYSPLGHGHSTSEVAGLDTALAGKSDTGHGHAITDVTGLDTALAGKSDTGHGHTPDDLGSGTPTAGQYLDGDGTWKDLPAGGGSPSVQVTPVVRRSSSGWWIGCAVAGSSTNNQNPGSGSLHFMPVMVSRQVVVDRIGAHHNSLGTGTVVGNLALYSSTADLLPGVVLRETGPFTPTTQWVGTVADFTLEPGVLYYIAAVWTTTDTMPNLPAVIAAPNFAGLPVNLNSGHSSSGLFLMSGVSPSSLPNNPSEAALSDLQRYPKVLLGEKAS